MPEGPFERYDSLKINHLEYIFKNLNNKIDYLWHLKRKLYIECIRSPGKAKLL